MRKVIWIFTLFLCHAATAADLFDNAKPRPFKLADPLEMDATIGGYPIWQGEGKWRLFNVVRRDSTGDSPTIPLGDVGVFQTEDKKFVAVMRVTSNLSGGTLKWQGEPCKRDDMLYKANIGKSIWQDNCVTINHIANYGHNPGGKDAELYALFVEQGISPPPTVLQIMFTRNGTSANTLLTTLLINPEILGFSRETEVNWGRNPWNKTMSRNDPAKKQFIDALGAWALQFAKQMDDALDKKADAFASVPSWRTVVSGQPRLESEKPKVTLD